MNKYYVQVKGDCVKEDIRETVEICTGEDVTCREVMDAINKAEDILRPDESRVLTYGGYVRTLLEYVCNTILRGNCQWQYVDVICSITI